MLLQSGYLRARNAAQEEPPLTNLALIEPHGIELLLCCQVKHAHPPSLNEFYPTYGKYTESILSGIGRLLPTG
jgi:hypothetical protein